MFLLPLFVPAMFIACLRLAIQVDVMHGNWSVPGLIAALAAKFRGRPAIVTLRGEDITKAETSWLFRCMLAACFRLNHRIVVVSASMRDDLQRQFSGHASQIEFIPNGVAINHPEPRPAFRAPLRLVTVSSLIERKRITTLLRALTYPGAVSGAMLRIVGDGPQRLALESVASELGVRQRVEFVGGVPPAEVPKQLGWGDLFVFASESEGRPNVILEAMAAGLPIVSTDIPGVRELIHPEGGLLYAVGEAQSLAQCINSLVEDPIKARNIGLAAQTRIQASGLTWTATANRYATLYHDVACPLADRSCAD